jgi:peptide/nickel transport system permease protein
MRKLTLLVRLVAIPLFLAALLCDFLSPCPPDRLDLSQPYAPPSRIHFRDLQGNYHWRPFTYALELRDPLDALYQVKSDTVHPLIFFVDGYRYRILGFIPASKHLIGTDDAAFHPWGTDGDGRDVLARALAGTRSSLLVLILGITIYFLLGVAIGAISGLVGGWTDLIFMRFSELILALPALYLVLALRALLPPNLPFWQTALLTGATIASITWPPMAKGVRGMIFQLQTASFIEASHALGASRWRIFRRHMLPALAPFALAQAAVAAPIFILGEVILSFLNVGFQDSGASWGTMLQNLTRDPRVFTEFWWNLSPLGFVFATLLCLNSFSRRMKSKVPIQLS